ncbi:WD repeat-containing protein 74 isoform X2 [Rhipicephalus sanguineus]|uniref:WD repeat-containing protein 74 isoform X2 n=1 Tax=Rhipicephalus sanguineus TaxID=34632 RepID=UPI0020C246F7|nr:WD repeat-containing protein 74 isoform X2 [Rhipicephalus sanguineus]
MAAPRYHVFVGAETGLLKGVNTEKRTFANLNSLHEVSKSNEITCLRWKDASESEIYAGIRSQTVKTFCPNSGICKDVFEVKGGEGPIKGLGVVNSNLVTCVSSGLLRVWAQDGNTQAETEVGADVFRMRQHPRKEGIVATGGKENELKLWDLENLQKPVFTAKNVRNDFLDLRVPVWVTDMDFMNDSEKIIAITGHHQVRVYDPCSRQRRPVIDFEFDEYPLTCLSLTPRPEQVVVGNSHGRVGLLDIRRKGMVHVYKGVAGSIRSVCCHPTLPIVLYLKSRLNCLLMRTDFTVEDEEENKDEEEAAADDELWEEMEEVDEMADVSVKKVPTKRSREVTVAKSKKRRKSIKKDG